MLPARGLVLQPRGVFLRSSLRNYNSALRKHPLLTKCVTCAVGMAAGDVIAQLLSMKKSRPFRFNYARVARSAIYGGLVNGPIGHYWYGMLDKCVFPTKATHPLTVVTKCALDQTLMAPIGVAMFLSGMKLLEKKPQECFEAVNTNMFSTMMQSYKLWPAAHIINFAFVPSDFRVLYVNTIAIAWSVIMIGQTQGAGPPAEVEAIHAEILA